MSFLGIDQIYVGTTDLIDLFRRRVSNLAKQKKLIKIIHSLDKSEAEKYVKKFFGKGRYKLVGIDGSQTQEERLEMLLFYICAAAYYGEMNIDEKKVSIDVSKAERSEPIYLSTAVPLWLEDLPDIALESIGGSTDYEIKKSIESVPSALMTLSELTLATKALKENDVKVIFLDRTLSGTYGPTSRDFRLLIKKGKSVITSIDTSKGKPSMLDLQLAGYLGPGKEFLPFRGVYGVYALINFLIKNRRKRIRIDDLPTALNLPKEKVKFYLDKLRRLNEKHNGLLLEEIEEGEVTVAENTCFYWERVWEASEKIRNKIFNGRDGHPLLWKGKEEKWVTTLDINTINMLTLHFLMNEAKEKSKLVIGIAKDTTATDMVRSVIPTFQFLSEPKPSKEALPTFKSDKALLSILSALNYFEIPVPWRTIEYDSSLTTTVKSERNNCALKAARKVILQEKRFIKGYFQLRCAAKDVSLRSPVFVYDRPYYPLWDEKLVKKIEVREFSGEAVLEPFFEQETMSRVGDIVLYILSCTDNPNVIEESGHNHLLFLADKYVKALAKQAGFAIKGVADLEISKVASKNKAFFISRRFRDIRSEAEHAREKFRRRESLS